MRRSGSANPGGAALDRYEALAVLLTNDALARPEDGARWVLDLVRRFEIPPLSAYGVANEHVPALVDKAAHASSMKANPIALSTAELERIIRSALYFDDVAFRSSLTDCSGRCLPSHRGRVHNRPAARRAQTRSEQHQRIRASGFGQRLLEPCSAAASAEAAGPASAVRVAVGAPPTVEPSSKAATVPPGRWLDFSVIARLLRLRFLCVFRRWASR